MILVAYPYAREGDYTIPEGIKRIGESAFFRCDALSGITIPDTVTEIGDFAFITCGSLINVTIPGSVKTIGVCAFSTCTDLESVTIQDGVKGIKDLNFYLAGDGGVSFGIFFRKQFESAVSAFAAYDLVSEPILRP